MIITTSSMDKNLEMDKKTSWLKRLGWLVAIWALSIAALGLVTFGLKLVMRAVGFHI